MEETSFCEWLDLVKGCCKRAQGVMGGIGVFLGVLLFTLLTYYVQKRDLTDEVKVVSDTARVADSRLSALYSEGGVFLDANYTEKYLKSWLVVINVIKLIAIANPEMVSNAQQVYAALETYEGLINTGIGKKRTSPSYESLDAKDKETLLRLCVVDWAISHGAISSKIESIRRYVSDPAFTPTIKSAAEKNWPDIHQPFHTYVESLGDKALVTTLFDPTASVGDFIRNVTGRDLSQQLQQQFYEDVVNKQTSLQTRLDDLKSSTIKLPVVDLSIPLVLAAAVALGLNLAFLGYVYLITVRFAVCVANAYGVATEAERTRLRVAISDYPLVGKRALKSDVTYAVWLAGPTMVSVAYPIITGEGLDARLSMHLFWAVIAATTIFVIALLLRRAAQDVAKTANVPYRFLAIEACPTIREQSKRKLWPQDFVAKYSDWPKECPADCKCLKTCPPDVEAPPV